MHEAPVATQATHLSPAQVVFEAFGSGYQLAKAIGRDQSAVYKWTKRKNGRIPDDALDLIYRKAKELGITLDANELIAGRTLA